MVLAILVFEDLGFVLDVLSVLELLESPILRLHLFLISSKRASWGARVVVSFESPMTLEIGGTIVGIPRPQWLSSHLREP